MSNSRTVVGQHIQHYCDLGHAPSKIEMLNGGVWIKQGQAGAVYVGALSDVNGFIDEILAFYHKAGDALEPSREV